jgi:hypothetical protein
MPTPSVADGCVHAHPTATVDTPVVDDFDVSALIARTIERSRRFPSPELVDEAAALFPSIPATEKAGRASLLHEGPAWRVSVSPGRVRVWTKDEADADRRENGEREDRVKTADALGAFLEEDEDGELVDRIPERIPSRTITQWSRKSRANMQGVLADLDFTTMFSDPTRPAAMVTVTYPGCWLPVASTGAEVTDHLKALRKRYERTFGATLTCIWKKEFQGRRADVRCTCRHCDGLDDGRAPHVHMLMCPPRVDRDGQPVNFKQWLSKNWAEVVDHPDQEQRRRHEAAGTRIDYAEGMKASDPNRVVTYFAKHGDARAKEYQHLVPSAWQEPGKGPGRFWGYWGLRRKVATAAVRPEVGADVGRTVRRYSRAQQVTRQVSRPRVRGGRPISKYPEVIGLAGAQLLASRDKVQHRKMRTRAVRAKNGRGWVRCNDAPRLAVDLAVWAHQRLDQRFTDANRAELARVGLVDTPLARAVRLPQSERREQLIRRLREKY